MRETTCCFTGHRHLPANKIENIIKRLSLEIDNLVDQGVTDFIAGGAVGFDQIAASLVIARKEQGYKIRLIFALPCRFQDANWTDAQKTLYRNLLSEADEIHYVSENYFDGCMKKRNQFMVQHSAICVCALLHKNSGTSQTVDYARKQGLKIINTAVNIEKRGIV